MRKDERRSDEVSEEFRERIRKIIEEEREVLDRLAE